MILDPSGLYGELMSYAMLFFFAGGALIAFLYQWASGRLDFSEQAKHEMMQDNERNRP